MKNPGSQGNRFESDPGFWLYFPIYSARTNGFHASMSRLLCMMAYKTSLFLKRPTRGALASLAHAVMHGCICVLTIMCVCVELTVCPEYRKRCVMDGGGGRNLQGAQLIWKSAAEEAVERVREVADPVISLHVGYTHHLILHLHLQAHLLTLLIC